jgi:hypothetical protein
VDFVLEIVILILIVKEIYDALKEAVQMVWKMLLVVISQEVTDIQHGTSAFQCKLCQQVSLIM